MEKQVHEIGSRVSIHLGPNKGQHGVIKYYGNVDGMFGMWYGVELDVSCATIV